MSATEGYLYIATGSKYIAEATRSVKSLRQLNSGIHATLITDKPIETPDFDEIQILTFENQHAQQWKSGLVFKVLALQNSPYDRTFFIDTDTFFVEDCKELFDLLQYHDLLISQAPSDTSVVSMGKNRLEGYFPYNTGVIVYNHNEAVKKLFKDWLNIYKNKFELYAHDQTSFMEALILNSVKLYVLQPIYNFRLPYFVSIPGLKVKILHGRPKNFRAISKRVNRNEGVNRTWNPNNYKIITKKPTLKYRIKKITPALFFDIYEYLKLNLMKNKRY